MYIAKLSLICLIAFSLLVGCGLMGKKAEMPEANTGSMEAKEGEVVKSESAEATTADAADVDAMAENAIQEVTLNVTGMT